MFSEANEKEAEKVSGQIQLFGLSSGGADGATSGKTSFVILLIFGQLNVVWWVFYCLSR